MKTSNTQKLILNEIASKLIARVSTVSCYETLEAH